MTEEKSGLYREALLEHVRNPRNTGRVENPALTARASNPLCGDELELTAALKSGTVEEIRFRVRGCAIVTAAASLMSEAVRGRELEQARELGRAFRKVMEGDGAALPAELSSLSPLLEVKKHRSRLTCALLPWQALAEAGEG